MASGWNLWVWLSGGMGVVRMYRSGKWVLKGGIIIDFLIFIIYLNSTC